MKNFIIIMDIDKMRFVYLQSPISTAGKKISDTIILDSALNNIIKIQYDRNNL